MMLLIFQGRLATWSTPLRLPFISSISNGHVMSQPCAEKCEHTLRWGSAPVRRPWVSLQGEAKDGFSLLFYCPPAQLCDVGFCSRLSSCWRDVVCFLFSAVSFQSYNHEGRTGPHLHLLQALIKPLKCNYSSSYFLKKKFCFLNK